MKTAVVFGGYGTFGALVSRELSRYGIAVIVAGRNRAQAGAFALELGGTARALECDLTNKESCLAALKSAGGANAVAVNCVGPFSRLGSALLEACLKTGCDYCDICDDRAYFKIALGMSAQFQARGLAAVPGCASLPAISGALAVEMLKGLDIGMSSYGKPSRTRVTLFIGNKNPKGLAAVSSAISSCGRAISTPQGILRGFRDGEVIPVPPPFGPRKAYNFESPEYDLFPELLGVKAVSVKAGFEMRAANWVFNLLAHLPVSYGPRLGKLLYTLGKFAPPFGCSGGAIVTELFWDDGSKHVAAICGREHGQRMAVLPCAYVAKALCENSEHKTGAMTSYDFLGARETITKLHADGFELWVDGKIEKGVNAH